MDSQGENWSGFREKEGGRICRLDSSFSAIFTKGVGQAELSETSTKERGVILYG
jgi:hypothetical protein